VLIAAITFGSPLPALLEADRTGEIKVSASAMTAWTQPLHNMSDEGRIPAQHARRYRVCTIARRHMQLPADATFRA
jgi:hypothetical protein